MKTKRNILVLILALMGLAVFFFWMRQPPSELTAEERKHYSKLLEKVYRQDDQQTKDVALESLSRRVAGLDINAPSPFWLGDAELDRRMCVLQLVLGELLPEAYYEERRLRLIYIALSTQTNKEEAVAYDKMLTCGQGTDDPYGKKSKEILDWVKGWDTVPVEELLEYVREMDDLKGQEDIRNFVKKSILYKADERGSKEASYILAIKFFDQGDTVLGTILLHNLAEEEHFPAQIEIARRYLDGDGFKKDLAKSYYWYTQAKTNGGRRELQRVLDTLRPQLSESELREAEEWKEFGIQPMR